MKKLLTVVTIASMTVGAINFGVNSIAYGASGPATAIPIALNGATITATKSYESYSGVNMPPTQNTVAINCKEVAAYPGKCTLYASKTDVVNLSITPPSGRTLTSWGSSEICLSKTTKCSFTIERIEPAYPLTLSFSTPVAPKPAAPVPTPTAAKPVENVSSLKINDQVPSDTQKLTFEFGKKITLSGNAPAGSLVTLYIFSTPRTVTTTASTAGTWTYEVSDLEAGDHRVESQVKDPATGTLSDRKEIARFAVTAAEPVKVAESVAAPTPKSNNTIWYAAAAGIFIVAAIISGLWFWRHKQSMKVPTETAAQEPVVEATPDEPVAESDKTQQ